VPEYAQVKVDARIEYSGKTYYGSLIADLYPNYGLVLRPLVITTEAGDIYLHLDYSDSLLNALTQTLTGENATLANVHIVAQMSPLIYLVWAGPTLMTIGIFLQYVSETIVRRKEKRLNGQRLSSKANM
jgi:hypothetical protein